MRKILFVIGNRAHYARVSPILNKIKKFDNLDYHLLLFEGASLDEYYYSIKEIVRKEHHKKYSCLYTHISGENLLSMSKSTGLALLELANEFERYKPDIVFVVADRYEALSAAIAARYMNIVLVHLQGGELSGSIDDSIRHSITKLANIHLVSNNFCAARVIQMGENPKNVYITGCPTIDLAKEIANNPKDISHLFKKYQGRQKKFDPEKDYVIVSFHPVTTEYDSVSEQFDLLLNAIHELNITALWLYPNIDAGNDKISKRIKKYLSENGDSEIYFFKNFYPKDFLQLVRNSNCIIGNSSVGIREAPAMGVPSVNIGSRQKSRERASSVFDSSFDKREIQKKIISQINHGKYPPSNIYGRGNASYKIAKVLSQCKFLNSQLLRH